MEDDVKCRFKQKTIMVKDVFLKKRQFWYRMNLEAVKRRMNCYVWSVLLYIYHIHYTKHGSCKPQEKEIK